MSITISGGWLDGQPIRKARKPFRCDCWLGLKNGGRHGAIVNAGDYYAVGDTDPEYAGGFGNCRYCLDCAGPEARAAVASTEEK